VAHLGELCRGAEHRQGARALAGPHLLAADRQRRRASHAGDPGDGAVVLEREVVDDAAERRHPGRLDLAGQDDDQVGAELANSSVT